VDEPRRKRTDPAIKLIRSPDDDGSAGAGPARANILIVDDHPANLVALDAILAPLGHDVIKAPSGEEALKHILRREFALILLDVQMAGMSGFETAGLIKQHPRSRHIPIIFITAVNRDAAHVFSGYSHGAVDYLVKPFDPDILRSKALVFIDLYLKGETIKTQERLLRQREREALERKSEERYHRLIDSMPQFMLAAGADGRVNYWNRAGLEYCGVHASEIDEESFWHVLHPDDSGAARVEWDRAVRGEVPFDHQARIRRASDGSYRWHLGRAVPERDDSGAIVGWIATATDIDDQKRAEEALQQAVRHRDDFLSVASHELRTPLTSLKLELANLARLAQRTEQVPGERLGAKVTKIEGQAERLHRLINELLDVSRIAAGRLEMQIEEVDLAQLASDVGYRFRDEAERTGCQLAVQANGPVVGRWDRSRLEQVITNLVSNALKYGDCKPVEIAVDGENGHARLKVRDHGLGIALNDQGRIFGRFERASSTRNFGGIGLGLWIVKEIVDALGGSVTVASEVGGGSTFTVELPRDTTDGVQSAETGTGARDEKRPADARDPRPATRPAPSPG
jgi:PAS domain S-box-containing protein